MSQQAHSQANRAAWSHRLQEATEQLGGSVQDEAAQLQADPRHTLRDYIEHLGDVRGQRVANLLGSSGKKAVALSLLGAQVTVVDFAEDNKTRALACAQAAGVEIDYILSDVLEWDTDPFEDHFDMVLMEFGILHYFVDLKALLAIIAKILKLGSGGLMIENLTERPHADYQTVPGMFTLVARKIELPSNM